MGDPVISSSSSNTVSAETTHCSGNKYLVKGMGRATVSRGPVGPDYPIEVILPHPSDGGGMIAPHFVLRGVCSVSRGRTGTFLRGKVD
jgi:hypothetical protein